MRGVPASRAISRTLAARAFALVALWPLVPLLSACPKIERLTVDGGPLDGGKADARVYAPSDAGDDAEAGPPAAPPVVVPPIDLVPPPNDADLAARAKHLLEAITQDKKVKGGKLTFILTRGLGQSFVADDVPPSEVLSFLREKLGD